MPATAVPGLSDLLDWSAEHLSDGATYWEGIAERWEGAFDTVEQQLRVSGWQGRGAQAATERAGRDRVQVVGLADDLRTGARIARQGASDVYAARSSLGYAVKDAQGAGFDVYDDYSVTDRYAGRSPAQQAARAAQAEEFAGVIRYRAAQLVSIDQQVGARVTAAVGQIGNLSFGEHGPGTDGVQLVDFKQGPPTVPLDSNSERVHNQEEAFKQVYGRDPVSANDWGMAAALDPHSYDPKNFGVPPEIVAGRFTPQPGKGVVRTNLFIPTDEVRNVAKDLTDAQQGRYLPMNLGDNRGPSATADIEASRVSMFVDYDHGVVVVRQNPTVNADGQRGGAEAGTPSVHVVQAPDGRMTVDYNAYDAYENPVGKVLGLSVNGRVTLSPQADGTLALGGNTTIYPSMETYQYRDGVPPAQLQWDPANSGGDLGPATSLSRHHWVGDATIPAVRPDMPGWKWELENAIPFTHDPFTEHTTQLTNPFQGAIPTVGTGR